MSVLSKTFAVILIAALPAGAAFAENGGGNGGAGRGSSGHSSGDRACGASVWIGGCGGITLMPSLEDITGSIPKSKKTGAVQSATGKKSAAKGVGTTSSAAAGKGRSSGERADDGASAPEHNRGKDNAGLNAGPGNGGEGAPGENGDRDPGNSGSHNNAPDSKGGKSKGHR